MADNPEKQKDQGLPKLLQASSGPARVCASGHVTAFENHPITLEFGTQSTPVTIVFRFESTEESDKARFEGTVTFPSRIELVLYNFNNVLGSGTKTPLKLGEWKEDDLYISFYVTKIGENRVLHYTLYVVEPGHPAKDQEGAAYGPHAQGDEAD